MRPKAYLTALSAPVIIALLVGCAGTAAPTPLAETALPGTPPVGTEAAVTLVATEPPGATPTPSQTFQTISAYEGTVDFIEAADADPDADLYFLYRQKAIDPFEEDCRLDTLPDEFVAPFDSDLDTLMNEVEGLRNSEVEQKIEQALQDAAALLPGPDVTVCIYPADPTDVITSRYLHGVNSRAIDARRFLLFINPVDDWLDWVPYVTAHEYHHVVWMARRGTNPSGVHPIEQLVMEGEADSFARFVYPDMVAPWTEALTVEQEAAQWQAIRGRLNQVDYDFGQDTMIGDGQNVPHWTGYTIGFHIVQAYLRSHPQVSIEEWTAMDPKVILAESSYNGQP